MNRKISTVLVTATFIFLANYVAAEDLTSLPLGDSKHSSGPKQGYIWPCHTDPNGGGAQEDGPWIKSDGTYDLTQKVSVPGSVTWPHQFTVSVEGDKRVFKSNDLPDHGTGIFPISRFSEAYQYDRNPNKIQEQNILMELPANPQLATAPSCAPGAVGILLSGVVLFNALDASGRDAVAHETQDQCQGHPQESGVYHYHSVSTCVDNTTSTGAHSALVGYMVDGFGIYGRFGEGGKALTSVDLDECHGHTHEIEWDGKMVTMYHYHATWDFPYTAGCMRGRYSMANVMKLSGPSRQGRSHHHGDQMQIPDNNMPPDQMSHDQMPPDRMNDRQSPPDRRGPPGGRPDLQAAAQKLGISEQQLRSALGPPPPNLSEAASKLGISESELRSALGVP